MMMMMMRFLGSEKRLTQRCHSLRCYGYGVLTLLVLAGCFVAWFLLVLQPYHPGMFFDPLMRERPVPPIIHQTYKTHQLPEAWQQMQRSWTHSALVQEHGYEYMFWTDEMNRHLIASEFPWFLEYYDAYPKPIQRVDAARLFILYKFGGIYVDLDIGLRAGCEAIIDAWRSAPVVLPHTTPVGYSNGFMMFEPKHPLIEQMIYSLPHGDPWWLRFVVPPYFRVIISTGPLFVTRQYLFFDHKDQVLSLSKDDYRHRCLEHGIGSSWHGDDVNHTRRTSSPCTASAARGTATTCASCGSLSATSSTLPSSSPSSAPSCGSASRREAPPPPSATTRPPPPAGGAGGTRVTPRPSVVPRHHLPWLPPPPPCRPSPSYPHVLCRMPVNERIIVCNFSTLSLSLYLSLAHSHTHRLLLFCCR